MTIHLYLVDFRVETRSSSGADCTIEVYLSSSISCAFILPFRLREVRNRVWLDVDEESKERESRLVNSSSLTSFISSSKSSSNGSSMDEVLPILDWPGLDDELIALRLRPPVACGECERGKGYTVRDKDR